MYTYSQGHSIHRWHESQTIYSHESRSRASFHLCLQKRPTDCHTNLKERERERERERGEREREERERERERARAPATYWHLTHILRLTHILCTSRRSNKGLIQAFWTRLPTYSYRICGVCTDILIFIYKYDTHIYVYTCKNTCIHMRMETSKLAGFFVCMRRLFCHWSLLHPPVGRKLRTSTLQW